MVERTPALESLLSQAARSASPPVRFAQRAKMVLWAARGPPALARAELVGIPRQRSARWRGRFLRFGLAGLKKGGRPARAAQEIPGAKGRGDRA